MSLPSNPQIFHTTLRPLDPLRLRVVLPLFIATMASSSLSKTHMIICIRLKIYLASGTKGKENAIHMMPLKARPRSVGELYSVPFPSLVTFRKSACFKVLQFPHISYKAYLVVMERATTQTMRGKGILPFLSKRNL